MDATRCCTMLHDHARLEYLLITIEWSKELQTLEEFMLRRWPHLTSFLKSSNLILSLVLWMAQILKEWPLSWHDRTHFHYVSDELSLVTEKSQDNEVHQELLTFFHSSNHSSNHVFPPLSTVELPLTMTRSGRRHHEAGPNAAYKDSVYNSYDLLKAHWDPWYVNCLHIFT